MRDGPKEELVPDKLARVTVVTSSDSGPLSCGGGGAS